jgi:CDP-diglyceride synthetase
MLDLYNYSLLTIFVVGFAAIATAIEIGRWLGARAGGKDDSSVSTLEGAVLGLVALIVGFTFAMSLSRFEARRDAVLVEANAIGTTALRARLLPEPHRQEVLGFLRDYTKIRLDVAQTALSRDELAGAVNKSNVLQEKL